MNLPTLSRQDAAKILGAFPSDLEYACWPETFGNTAGPFGGVGGQMLTSFQMEAWINCSEAVIFTGGRVVGIRPFGIDVYWEKRK